MFLTAVLVQVSIIIGVILLFFIANILNSRVKPPQGVELPEKCGACPSNSCIVKISNKDDVEKKKEEIKEFIEKCEKEEK